MFKHTGLPADVSSEKKKVLLVGLSPPGTIEGHVAKCANVL